MNTINIINTNDETKIYIYWQNFSLPMIGLMVFGHSANATIVFWDLFDTFGSTGNTNLGTTATYTSVDGFYNLDFAGFTDADPIEDPAIASILVENNRGDNEEGLGVLSGNGEVDLNEYIRIDLGVNWEHFFNWAVNFDSLDSNETAMLGTLAHSDDILAAVDKDTGNIGNGFLSFTPTAQIIYFSVGFVAGEGITANFEDVLLHTLMAEVPEPGTLIMMAMGLVLLGFSRRKSV